MTVLGPVVAENIFVVLLVRVSALSPPSPLDIAPSWHCRRLNLHEYYYTYHTYATLRLENGSFGVELSELSELYAALRWAFGSCRSVCPVGLFLESSVKELRPSAQPGMFMSVWRRRRAPS